MPFQNPILAEPFVFFLICDKGEDIQMTRLGSFVYFSFSKNHIDSDELTARSFYEVCLQAFL
jgi:hypothetical protein